MEHKLFKKIDIKLPDMQMDKLLGQRDSKHTPGPDLFREYEISDMDYLHSVLGNVLHFDIQPNRYNVTVIEKFGAPPHTDIWPTALNIYLEIDGNEDTLFFDNPSGKRIEVPTNPGLFFYYPDLLVEAGRFVANQSDCYLLDTHTPHAVSNENDNRRVILRCVWFYKKFDTVLDSIKILPR